MYTYQRQVTIGTGLSTAAAAVVARLAPGLKPMVLREVAMVFITAPAGAGTLKVETRPTAGSAAGKTDQKTLNFDATLGTAGKVVYARGLNLTVNPGGDFGFEIGTNPATGVFDLIGLVEEKMENIKNNANAVETT